MRVAINLLADDPGHPSGAHWFWTRILPELAARMSDGEELHLVVSPRSRPLHAGYGPTARYITFPWSNERPYGRILTEQLYAPARLPLSKVDVFSTLIAPIVKPAPSLVVHFKTMHAFTTPGAIKPANRLYRQLNYPRTARVADAVIINSESLREEAHRYLDLDPAKVHLIPEAVDHELFCPGDPDEARGQLAARFGIVRPFVLFVSSLWPYKNCAGILRAFAIARAELPDRQLVVVGPGRDQAHVAELRALAAELDLTEDVVWVGGVPLEETVQFYRGAEVFVYPSLNETFGLPLLEAMACACPVVTSNVSAMPETAGGAALLADPTDPESLADAVLTACGPAGEHLREAGLRRSSEFTWAATAERTLAVYRLVHTHRSSQGSRRWGRRRSSEGARR